MKKTILLFGLVITTVAQHSFGQLLHIINDNSMLAGATLLEARSEAASLPEASITASLANTETVALANAKTTAAPHHLALKTKTNEGTAAKTKYLKDLITSYSIFPNPAYADANVRFGLSQPSQVKVSVYNLLGERMRFEGVESNNKYPAGENMVTLNTAALTSGVYLVELIADNTRMVKRLSVVK